VYIFVTLDKPLQLHHFIVCGKLLIYSLGNIVSRPGISLRAMKTLSGGYFIVIFLPQVSTLLSLSRVNANVVYHLSLYAAMQSTGNASLLEHL